MTIIKKVLGQLKFVDGVPAIGQTRINWIQNGEYLDAATSATDNGGALNRGAVKVQANVDTISSNQDLIKSSLDETIDKVNAHDSIINATGDGSNLYTRVTAVETTNTSQGTTLVDHTAKFAVADAKFAIIETAIGTQPSTEPVISVRADITRTKQMLGNYKGFDVNGNPAVNAEGLGVKGQVERNWESVSNHETRIKGLEAWWDGDTPDVLIRNTRDLRTELGQSTSATTDSVYTRLSASESKGNSNATAIARIDTQIGTSNFPLQYTNASNVVSSVPDLYQYARAIRGDVGSTVTKVTGIDTRLTAVEGSMGTKPLPESKVWDSVTSNKTRMDAMELLVGPTPLDGLRGYVKTVDDRETNNYNRHDGIIQSINNTINLDMKPSLTTLEDEVTKASTGLKSLVRGTLLDTDPETLKLGISATNKLMYDNMYKPFVAGSGFLLDPNSTNIDSAFVRRYVSGAWTWADVFNDDIVIGLNKRVRTPQNIAMISHEPRDSKPNLVVVGSTDSDNAIRGTVVEPIKVQSGVVSATSKNLVSSDDVTVSIGSDLPVKIGTSDKSGLKVRYGSVDYPVVHTGNIIDYIKDIDPRDGFDMNRDKVINMTVTAGKLNLIKSNFDTNTITVGASQSTLSIDGVVSKLVMKAGSSIAGINVDANSANMVSSAKLSGLNYVVIGDNTNSAVLHAAGSDLKSTKVKVGSTLHAIWHDGLDAPSDGAYYARMNGAWTTFNPNGGGSGIGSEAPDNGLQYTRKSLNGTGSWEVLGSKNISLNSGIKVVGNTTNSGVVDVINVSAGGVLTVGEVNSTRKTVIGGLVGSLKFDANTAVTSTINNRTVNLIQANTGLEIGDATITTTFANVPKVTYLGSARNVWHDGIDAPSDGKYYARQSGTWQSVFNGVNPDADVNLNLKSYKSGNIVVGGTEQVGSDFIVNIGDSAQYTRIRGKVMGMRLAQPAEGQSTEIRGMLDGADVNVISTSDRVAGTNRVVVGDASLDLDLKGRIATINDDVVMTINAYEAPKNGKRYSRKNGAWVESYYYGNFASAPTTPTEGDVFFEFVN